MGYSVRSHNSQFFHSGGQGCEKWLGGGWHYRWNHHLFHPLLDWGDVDKKISTATNYFGGVLSQMQTEVSNLKGQLSDAKQDRDKYQLMLAPFEAMAIAKYTNEPLDQRLELLSSAMVSITNALNSEIPILSLTVNGITLTNISAKLGDVVVPNIVIPLDTNRIISFVVFNYSEPTAEHITIDFLADIDPTNIFDDQWALEPKGNDEKYHWNLVATGSFGQFESWSAQSIRILKSFKQSFFVALIGVHADRSKTFRYVVLFELQN